MNNIFLSKGSINVININSQERNNDFIDEVNETEETISYAESGNIH